MEQSIISISMILMILIEIKHLIELILMNLIILIEKKTFYWVNFN